MNTSRHLVGTIKSFEERVLQSVSNFTNRSVPGEFQRLLERVDRIGHDWILFCKDWQGDLERGEFGSDSFGNRDLRDRRFFLLRSVE